jgi:hypothetical protein
MIRVIRGGALAALIVTVAGCGSEPQLAAVDDTQFAVFSDPHLLDTAALGASGPDFEAYLADDRKMLAQSEELLDAALADLQQRHLDFVLVSGDLTKDGERVNHQKMAAKLARLSEAGTRVYVVPGNHDVENPDARSFLTTPATPVPSVTPAEFAELYADAGYRGALARDPASLSYLAEPVPGLWLLAIDSCEYEQNQALGRPVTAGKIRPATMEWILARLNDAKAQRKQVIGMMHHGVVEHYQGQASQFSEYLLEDYQAIGKTLADAGLSVVFTGHFHANDVSTADFGTAKLTDVETGSLVTAPAPYRLVDAKLEAHSLAITTRHVTSIPSRPNDFVTFENAFLMEGLRRLTVAQLTQAPYGLDAVTAGQVAPLIAGGLAAHYGGDETLTDPASEQAIAVMTQSTDPLTRMLGASVASLWTDLAPADNDVVLQLR